MFNYSIAGFDVVFDDHEIKLDANLFNLNDSQLDNLRTFVIVARQVHKSLLGAAKLNELVESLTAQLSIFERLKFAPSDFVTTLNYCHSEEGQAQIELWYSYMLDYPTVHLDGTDAILTLWDLIDKATQKLKRYRAYERFKPLSLKFPLAHDGYVYLFQLSTGHYKIGFSNNPQRRGREITSGLPFSIELLHQIQSNQIACLEYELHVRYADKRHGDTEWFSLTDAEVLEIKRIADCMYPWIKNDDWDIEFRRPEPTSLFRPKEVET